MKRVPELPLQVRAGGPLGAIVGRPLPPYSPPAMGFLAALSKSLLANAAIHDHPDIAAFAFWCRRANLERLAREFGSQHRRVGRGLVLHIAPANVPVNFAYSLAFGLLAGNANIVRIPEANHPQAEVICDAIASLFELPEHAQVAAMNRLVRYPRDDAITGALSAHCHARVLWGGDATVAHIKAIPASPRCVDIAFADRYSLCLMGAQALLEADDAALHELALGFYNDAFILDQNACSSPHLVLWLGDAQTAGRAMQRFWDAMAPVLDAKHAVAPVHAVDKFVQLCRSAIVLPEASASQRQANLAWRVQLSALPANIEHHRGRHGFFHECAIETLDSLAGIVDERYQTLTCWGVDREAVASMVVAHGLHGIDRVVPVGKALDMGVIWDGYDLVGSLSRIVQVQ
jgi:hypothetical protein